MDGKWHTSNKATIWRWRSAYQNDFAARMDWTIKPYAEANHPPVARLEHANRLTVKSGERVNLSAEGSTDPDGDALVVRVVLLRGAGHAALVHRPDGGSSQDRRCIHDERLVYGAERVPGPKQCTSSSRSPTMGRRR